MPSDSQQLKDALRKKDKEIKELKEFLAEAEAELKEYTNADHMIRPRASILESRFLNKMIKGTFFFLLCAIIIIAGVYPWLFKDRIFGNGADNMDEIDKTAAEYQDEAMDNTKTEPTVEDAASDKQQADAEAETRDIFKPEQVIEVSSDLGWLNVRTEPNVETGDVIKKINSGEDYQWLEKTADNWYKIVIDAEGHTGFVSGEYVVEK